MIKIKVNHGASVPSSDAKIVDQVYLSYEQRTKGRLKVTSIGGEELGLFLERGKVLCDADILESEDGRLWEVKASEESLIVGRCDSWELFSRCCYHLGNRHVPLQIGERELAIQADHILSDMLEQLGMTVEKVLAPFTPEQGAYSGGHHHHAH